MGEIQAAEKEAETLGYIGNIYEEESNYLKAAEYYIEAYEIEKDLGE